MNAETPAKSVIDDLPRGCFTRRARYRNDFVTGLPAIFSGQLTECSDCILDFKQALAGGFFLIDIFADNGTNGAFYKGVGDVIVAIEILAGNREKAVAGFCGSRVGTYAGEETSLVAPLDFARGRRDSWLVCFYYPGQVFG